MQYGELSALVIAWAEQKQILKKGTPEAQAWKTVEDADQAGQLNVKANALKLISDIETKRITMLKEVGLLDNAEMAAQIAETEHKQDILVKILKEVTASCPKCKMDVARRLSQITGVVEPIEIIQEANES